MILANDAKQPQPQETPCGASGAILLSHLGTWLHTRACAAAQGQTLEGRSGRWRRFLDVRLN